MKHEVAEREWSWNKNIKTDKGPRNVGRGACKTQPPTHPHIMLVRSDFSRRFDR